ncbi:MAG: serine/threonine-protein phosphatase [Chlorobi bacterium]|nr:serine/threonine-protein phosphatase [Chlorobiota bacterium]
MSVFKNKQIQKNVSGTEKTRKLKIYRHFGKSNKGLVRTENQDAFAYFETVNGAVFIVCDGMGGIPGGKEAAEFTVKKIKKFISSDWYDNEKELIIQAFNFANSELRKKKAKPEAGIYPGTTVALVLIRDNNVFYAHAGDSRIYYQTGKRLFSLTEDHSLRQKLLNERKIGKKEAENYPQKNIIYNAAGINPEIKTDVSEKALTPVDDDYILICSDGLTNELSDKKILEILRKKIDLKAKAKMLITRALENGGSDNVTVVLIKFYNTGKKNGKYFFAKKSNSAKKYKKTAIFGALILFAAILLSGAYFFNKYQKKQNKNFPETIITNDLIYKDKNKKYFRYRTGRNIFSYPGIKKNNIINIFEYNNKRELYFYPGEKFKIPHKNGSK